MSAGISGGAQKSVQKMALMSRGIAARMFESRMARNLRKTRKGARPFAPFEPFRELRVSKLLRSSSGYLLPSGGATRVAELEREIDKRVAELYGPTNAGITSAEREVSCSG